MLRKAKEVWSNARAFRGSILREHIVPDGAQGTSEGESKPSICAAISTTVEMIFDISVRAALQQTGAEAAAIAIRINGKLACVAQAGENAPPLGTPLHETSGITGACMSGGQVINCQDADTHDLVDREVCRQLSIRSILAVPISDGKGTVGLLEVWSPKVDAFKDTNVVWLIQLARTIQLLVVRTNLPMLNERTQPAPAVMAAASDHLKDGHVGRNAICLVPAQPENEFDTVRDILQQSIGRATWAQIRQQLASRMGVMESDSEINTSTGNTLLTSSKPDSADH
ncbi:MAG: hypothetical protein NVS1B11_34390 [Terriglobales bacterium]